MLADPYHFDSDPDSGSETFVTDQDPDRPLIRIPYPGKNDAAPDDVAKKDSVQGAESISLFSEN